MTTKQHLHRIAMQLLRSAVAACEDEKCLIVLTSNDLEDKLEFLELATNMKAEQLLEVAQLLKERAEGGL